MRCPSCTTEVPEARFCARCGARLAGAGAAPSPSVPAAGEEVTASRWTAVAAVAALVAAVTLGAAWTGAAWTGAAWPGAERGADDEVALPSAADLAPADVASVPRPSPSPFVASPSATVLCSDLSEHRVKYAWLDDAELGDTVDIHGTPCIVTAIDADARPRDYPRGVARGNRPGVGPRR